MRLILSCFKMSEGFFRFVGSKFFRGFLSAHGSGQEAYESQAEVVPCVVGDDIFSVGCRLQCADIGPDETEIAEYSAQAGAHPHGSDLAVHLFEEKEPACRLRIEAGRFDDTHECFCLLYTSDAADD